MYLLRIGTNNHSIALLATNAVQSHKLIEYLKIKFLI